MGELQSLSSLDSTSEEFFIQVTLIIITEMISGIWRVTTAPRSGSAWTHALVSCLLLLYFVIFGIGYKKWGEGALDKKESLYGSYADTLTARQSTDKNAKEAQIDLINQEKTTMESLSSIYNSHMWVTGIAGGLFTLAEIAVSKFFNALEMSLLGVSGWGI